MFELSIIFYNFIDEFNGIVEKKCEEIVDIRRYNYDLLDI